MGSEARIFFAGLGASFVFLATVLVFARPALDDPPSRKRASSDPFSAMRVTLPAAAEPATAPSDPPPQIQPAKDVQAEKLVEGENKLLETERPKTKKELKAERRKKQAERRLKRKNAHRGRQRAQLQTPQEPAIVALGGSDR
jgi:hypothetical protein